MTQRELDHSLFRSRGMPPNPQNTPLSASDSSLFYYILVGSMDPKVDMWEITAESFNVPERVPEEPDLAVFKSSPPSSSPYTMAIQPSYSNDSYYFRVAVAHTATAPVSESENLALELYRNRTLQSLFLI